MVYASFRCRVDAPLLTVWGKLREAVKRLPRESQGTPTLSLESERSQPDRQRLKLPGLVVEEEIRFDPERREITLILGENPKLCGARRFVVRDEPGNHSVLIESILDWRAADPANDDMLFHSAKLLVRDLLLDLKQETEAR